MSSCVEPWLPVADDLGAAGLQRLEKHRRLRFEVQRHPDAAALERTRARRTRRAPASSGIRERIQSTRAAPRAARSIRCQVIIRHIISYMKVIFIYERKIGGMPRKIILDCDPGHDDAIAMLLAHGNPEIELVGVTTVMGNQTIEKVTRNALVGRARRRASPVCRSPRLPPAARAARRGRADDPRRVRARRARAARPEIELDPRGTPST